MNILKLMHPVDPLLASTGWQRASTVGLLLAAGRGERYAALSDGADKLLACLPDGRAVLEAAASTLLAAIPCVLAVVPPGHVRRASLLRELGCAVVELADAERGMGASMAGGVRWLMQHGVGARSVEPVNLLVALADMPWLAGGTIRDLLAFEPQAAIAVPRHVEGRGHPVRFAQALWPQLAALDGDTGARGLFAHHVTAFMPTQDAGVLRDVDVPDALR